MKIRIQFTPELTIALICAGGWTAFWLWTFRPVSPAPPAGGIRTELTRLITDDETLRKLKAPTLFALPSSEGFSGKFLGNRVELHLTLEKPASAVRYLPPENAVIQATDSALLAPETKLPQSELPVPGAEIKSPVRPSGGIQLFPSPELELRGSEALPAGISAAGLPETVRVNLALRSDGTVRQAFFETPVTNAALLSAVRQLRFKPSASRTEGWVDIRFPQEGAK